MVKLTDPSGGSFYLNAIHVLSVTPTSDASDEYKTIVMCVEESVFKVQEDVDDVARVISSALRSIGR